MIEIVMVEGRWQIIRGPKRTASPVTEDRARAMVARLGLRLLDDGPDFERWGPHPGGRL